MNLVESVFETAEKFMKDSDYVEIDYENLDMVANDMREGGMIEFPKKDDSDQYKTCLKELVGNSINYCYWYGKSTIRPGDSSSTKMYDLVDRAFRHYSPGGGRYSIDNCIDDLIKMLSLERFPMLEERIKHLNELRLNAQKFVSTIFKYKDEAPADFILNSMMQIFPGYASDIFLKRAFLFFCQLYRNFGWFEDFMKQIPVPADYQVPKLLNHFGIIIYEEGLYNAITNEEMIPKWSSAECEIRAATIIACRELVRKTGYNTPQVDGYFWLRRKEVLDPFHLTVTTDY